MIFKGEQEAKFKLLYGFLVNCMNVMRFPELSETISVAVDARLSRPNFTSDEYAVERFGDVRTGAVLGRHCCQEVASNARNALAETAMVRYRGLIGTPLRARNDAGRRSEGAVDAVALTRILATGRPHSVHTVCEGS